MHVRRIGVAFGVVVFIVGMALAGWWWKRRIGWPTVQPQESSRVVISSGRPLTEWFYADGMINSENAPLASRKPGLWAPSREWIVILNLTGKPTTATSTFYFENRPPLSVTRSLPARASSHILVHELAEVVKPGELYGVRIQSNGPIIVQPTRGEYERDNPVTRAMASFVAHPGPLGKRETKWAYADGLVLSSAGPLEEREWITILNPNAGRDARVTIRFLRGGPERTHPLLVPAERVRTVDLFESNLLPKNELSGIVAESDIPIIVEQVRRAYFRGVPVIASMWACLALPIGDQDTE